MRRLATRALPALVLLAALAANAQLAALARALLWLLARAASLALVLAGSGSVWWALRAWQLREQQELLDQAWAKLRFLQRYRSSTGGSSSSAAEPRTPKRLPLPVHLRTAWGLPPEVADELALVAQLAVRDYVGFWYQPLSPANDDFPADLRLLLGDLLGALAARVLEIDSSQALAAAASAIEILRLHFGWFREAYAQLGEDFPEVFGDAGGDAGDENLLRRQEYVARFVQKSPLLHPGCAAGATKKPARETSEVVYLRHVASQLLVQLKPELGYQYDASVFVSLVMNLMREAATFKILKPMAEYAQQRYANELVLAGLQAFLGDKDGAGLLALSPAGHSAVGSLNALSSAASNSISGVGGMTLNKLRSTKSFLYKATKRSSEQAEAAFQAVVDAVNSAGPDALADAVLGVTPPSSTKNAAAGAPERRPHFGAPFSFNDRLSIPRTARLKTPRAFLPGGSGGLKAGGVNGGGGHIDDLKNIKANIGSSLNKVKRRFRTLSGHPNDPETPNSGGVGFPSTQAAARMMKKPGMLLQKALRRGDGPAALSPLSPTNSLDEVVTPPPLSDDDFVLGDGDLSDPPSPSRAELTIDELAVDAVVLGDDDDEAEAAAQLEAERVAAAAAVRERAVELVEKAVAGYVRMCQERPEMRSSARARELFELLSALEDLFLLGYTDAAPVSGDLDGDGDELADLSTRYAEMEADGRRSSQQYWNFLAQDRPETPFLNDHWQFVAAKCPACAESESFCSTRGVQWILVALEKGRLWEFTTALHLNQAVTERFYDPDESVFRHGKLMESVLQSLFQLNQVAVALEIPSLLGRKGEMDEAFGVSASVRQYASSSQSGVSSSSTVVCVLECVWEVERYVPIQGWTKTQDKRWQELPSSEWMWDGEWTLEAKDAVNSSLDTALALEAAAASGDLWEYAKTFEDRFHDKEKKFDSVRRRRWVRRRRQLPFVLSAAAPAPRKPAGSLSAPPPPPPPTPAKSPVLAAAAAPRKLPSSPPALFGAASLLVAPASTVIALGAAGKVRNVKQFFDLSKRGKSKTDDTAVASPSLPFARRPLMKRRSNSFDKSMFASPIADLVLALESPKKLPLSPEKKTASPEAPKQQKKRRSIPSLRRSTTSSLSKDAKAALGLVRSTTTGSTTAGDESAERRSSLLDSDGDEDDKLCFRCFTPLHGNDADESEDAVVAFDACPSCQQRVCSACLASAAFLVFPPPLEVSRKARVCSPCYERLASKCRVKVEAHVSKYFVRERDLQQQQQRESSDVDTGGSQNAGGDGSDTEATSASVVGRSASAPRFEVVVFVKDKAACAWSVVKTFPDFEALEKQLSEKLRKQEKKHGAGGPGSHWKGVDYAELQRVAPSLRTLPVAALSYEQRLYVLEEFVQSLLATDTLGQSPAVQKFLALSNAAASADRRLHPPFSPTAAAALRASDALPSSPGSAAEAAGATGGGVVVMENGKWRKGRWVAPETSSKETKVRLLQKLEVSLFAVVGEMFEFDGIGVVRRQLFAMSRSFIKAFLSASHFRKLEKQYLSFTDPKKVAAALVAFRAYMFPDPDAAPPPAPPVTLSAAELQALRKDVLDAILASFPSTLVSLFGDTACENAALKLHEFVQHEVFVKNLLFSVADEVLQQLFPDFVLLRAKPTAPTASASSMSSSSK